MGINHLLFLLEQFPAALDEIPTPQSLSSSRDTENLGFSFEIPSRKKAVVFWNSELGEGVNYSGGLGNSLQLPLGAGQ